MASPRIVINSGHGPKNSGIFDPGAIGPTGLKESDQAYEVSKLVQSKLSRNGWMTVLIQDGDLWDVSNKSNQWGAEYLVSIHGNSVSSPSAHGIETFYYKQADKTIAEAVQAELIKVTNLADRGAKYGNLHVIRETKCPAILVEVGFISNPKEEALMKQDSFDEKVAEAICVGLSKALEIPYKQEENKMAKLPALILYFGDAEERIVPYLQEDLKAPAIRLGIASLQLVNAFEEVHGVGGTEDEYVVEGQKIKLFEHHTGKGRKQTGKAVLDYVNKG